MSSASKTLELVRYFSPEQPEIGLSQMARLARRDKATTHRHLQVLEDFGMVEQNPVSKQYRLGPAVLQLAQTREETVPRKAAVERPLTRLAATTGETAHVSVLSGTTLYNLSACKSREHGTRAIVDLDRFPLHATASGLCALAFGPAELLAVAGAQMRRFTDATLRTPEALEEAVAHVRSTGFARSSGGLEAEVCGLAAPLYDTTGTFAGAVSVASVATRFTPALEALIRRHLISASREITRNWGGTVPAAVEALWADPHPLSPALEPAP